MKATSCNGASGSSMPTSSTIQAVLRRVLLRSLSHDGTSQGRATRWHLHQSLLRLVSHRAPDCAFSCPKFSGGRALVERRDRVDRRGRRRSAVLRCSPGGSLAMLLALLDWRLRSAIRSPSCSSLPPRVISACRILSTSMCSEPDAAGSLWSKMTGCPV